MAEANEDTELNRENCANEDTELNQENCANEDTELNQENCANEDTELNQENCASSEKTRFGCSHYERKCAFVAPCCSKVYPCRFCHDAAENHSLNRADVEMIQCLCCEQKQSVRSQCEKCETVFAKYFCSLCRLYDDSEEDKQQFHCDGCGLCRIGGQQNYFHCDKCGICLSLRLRNSHKCVERVSQSNCPICLENMHSSRKGCAVPQCGHLIHEKCLQQLYQNCYSLSGPRCPICQSSFMTGDAMKSYWDDIEREISGVQMPEEYRNCTVLILCNDCNKESEATFHVIGHKCALCGSFNTSQLTGPKQSEQNNNRSNTNESLTDSNTESSESVNTSTVEVATNDIELVNNNDDTETNSDL